MSSSEPPDNSRPPFSRKGARQRTTDEKNVDLIWQDEENPFENELSEATMKITIPSAVRKKREAVQALRVVAGPDLLKFALLEKNRRLMIGRDEQRCGLCLGDASVSRIHASILSNALGEFVVEDHGSTNGTRVNGELISRAFLEVGDHLEVGVVSLRLDLLSNNELSHLKKIRQQLKDANRDALTGLLTRAYFEQELPQLLSRCERSGLPISVMFIDIDHFKRINDSFGHAAGDDVLRTLSRLMLLRLRDSDPCVRYGGEELVAFLPGSREGKSQEIADRLRRSISGHDWSRTAPGLRVTASIGVAERGEGETLTAWLDRADKALYQAKRSGRNRVIAASKVG